MGRLRVKAAADDTRQCGVSWRLCRHQHSNFELVVIIDHSQVARFDNTPVARCGSTTTGRTPSLPLPRKIFLVLARGVAHPPPNTPARSAFRSERPESQNVPSLARSVELSQHRRDGDAMPPRSANSPGFSTAGAHSDNIEVPGQAMLLSMLHRIGSTYRVCVERCW
jgi:hypothetical protein